MNKLLEELLPRLIACEKNISLTEQQTSVALKLTLAMFINTSIITFAIYYDDTWYGTPSLIEDISDIIIVILVILPIENILTTFLKKKFL